MCQLEVGQMLVHSVVQLFERTFEFNSFASKFRPCPHIFQHMCNSIACA